jgi:hypothetical protein
MACIYTYYHEDVVSVRDQPQQKREAQPFLFSKAIVAQFVVVELHGPALTQTSHYVQKTHRGIVTMMDEGLAETERLLVCSDCGPRNMKT